MIRQIRYDPASQELCVQFTSDGSVYIYSGVPEDEADSFGSAASVGSYFHDNIKDTYASRRG
jgi:hypothetical protein